MGKTITKPKQAASARTLDRWQQHVRAIIGSLEHRDSVAFTIGLAERLLRSMQRAERR